MCGIAGVIGNNVTSANEVTSKMLATIKHRGPDCSAVHGIYPFGALGHNRLSIIDLDASANQPFVSDDGRYVLVFNGEIYNYIELKNSLKHYHTFKTNSDTEVLLASYIKWGVECVDRFMGMFSFAIWDNKESKLFAARDRFGVKPFYYALQGDTLLFASEIKALWAGGVLKQKNSKVWASYFVYGSYGNPDETFWRGVEQLPGGHILIWSPESGVKIKKWYCFEDRVRSSIDKWKEAIPEQISIAYYQLLRESISLRFRADVPIGFNVSGGLDSSLLLSLIRESYPDNTSINAFTFFTGNVNYDELPWVNELIKTTRYPLHPVLLKSDHVPSLAEKVAYIQDEPYGGIPTIAYSEIFKVAREKGTIVLLDGQGIDEAWAGYDYYYTKSDNVVQGVNSSPVRPDVLDEDFRKLAVKPTYPEMFDSKLLNLQCRDLFFTKIPRALRFNDRMSMMYSTELREPFLDHRIVEFAFSLPDKWKVQNSTGKFLLRQMVHKLLPETIRLAPKRALQTPQREWLCTELREWVDSKINLYANQSEVQKTKILNVWDDYKNRGGDNSFFIWQWLNAQLLH